MGFGNFGYTADNVTVECAVAFPPYLMKRGFFMQAAKLFQNGRSQAVRLPKAFRMPGKEVKISKQGNKIILEPITRKTDM